MFPSWLLTKVWSAIPITWSLLEMQNLRLHPWLTDLESTFDQDSEVVFFFFFGCAMLHVGSQLPNQGLNPVSLAVEAWSPNHWTAKEFLILKCLYILFEKQWYIAIVVAGNRGSVLLGIPWRATENTIWIIHLKGYIRDILSYWFPSPVGQGLCPGIFPFTVCITVGTRGGAAVKPQNRKWEVCVMWLRKCCQVTPACSCMLQQWLKHTHGSRGQEVGHQKDIKHC